MHAGMAPRDQVVSLRPAAYSALGFSVASTSWVLLGEPVGLAPSWRSLPCLPPRSSLASAPGASVIGSPVSGSTFGMTWTFPADVGIKRRSPRAVSPRPLVVWHRHPPDGGPGRVTEITKRISQ